MERVLLAFTVAVAVIGGLLSQAAPAVERPRYHSVGALEARMLDRLNSLRARRGLPPLRASRALSYAAHHHSNDMARNGFCGHESADGVSFSKRLARFYRRGRGWRAWSAGENVFCHPRRLSAGVIVDRWLASPGHRANVLAPQWQDVGVSAVYTGNAAGAFGGQDALFVTADFGFRE